MFLCSCEAKKAHKTTTEPSQNAVSTDTIVAVVEAEKKDTIIAPKGHQVFRESVKLRNLYYVHGYIFKDVEVSFCEESIDGPNPNAHQKITSLQANNDGFSVAFTVIGNCCSEFLCEATILEDATLNIIYHEFGRFCSCNCLFTLTYSFEVDHELLQTLENKKTKITHIQFNDEKNSRVEFKEY